jgi:hypothetical protein
MPGNDSISVVDQVTMAAFVSNDRPRAARRSDVSISASIAREEAGPDKRGDISSIYGLNWVAH